MMRLKDRFGILTTLFILICLLKTALAQTNTPDDIPKELITYMASRQMRYHHFLWHNLRNQWYNLDPDTQAKIKKLGWAPPRPAYTPAGTPDKSNDSGEDFLYMHRTMIADANKIMSKYSKSKKITGFTSIPAPGDKTYPVPRGGYNEDYAKWKNDDFYWTKIKPLEDKFKNPDYLRTLTLGQLGSLIEFGIHNYLHIRFSDTPDDTRPDSSEAMPYIDKEWDDPKYTWLLDTYASHVHPVFWKIHGWVDDRIEDWRKANNIKTIKWKGTWTGGPQSNISNLLATDSGSRSMQQMSDMHKHDHNYCVMSKVVRLLLKTKNCFYYYCYV